MTNPELEIVWDGGSLDLMGENDTAYGPVTIQALADGTEWGNPQSVRRALFSALADGSASALERHDNRMPVVKLRLTAADSAALAGGEAPLHMLSTKRRVELRWTPPNDFAAPAVFILTESDLTHQMDDFAENRCVRYYTLSTKALPWALSVDEVVIEALPPFVAAPDVLDDCTSTTGWTAAFGSPTFAVGGGGVEISAPAGDLLMAVSSLTKSIARAKRYLAIEYELVAGTGNGWPTPRPIGQVRTSLGGWSLPPLVGAEGKWTFFDLPDSLGSVEEMRFGFYPPSSGGTQILARILTIAESDTPAASAGKQTLRAIATPGSARTEGSLLVESRDADDTGAGTVLEQVIVYTGAQYDPRLSFGRSVAASIDTDSLSGKQATGTAHFFYRYARDFPTDSYDLWVHAKGTAGPVTWTVSLNAANPMTLESLADLAQFQVTVPLVGTGYNLINLGTLDLPGLANMASSSVALRFSITTSSATGIGEVLVFGRTNGSLSVVDTTDTLGVVEDPPGTFTTTAGSTRVWLNSASLASGPAVVAGRGTPAGSLPASLDTHLLSWMGSHLFTPDATYLYVATTGATDPKVTGTFRPAWHTHPAS